MTQRFAITQQSRIEEVHKALNSLPNGLPKTRASMLVALAKNRTPTLVPRLVINAIRNLGSP